MKLQKTGIILLGLILAVIMMVLIVSSAEENSQEITTIQHSIETNSSVSHMSQSEFRGYVQEMSEKYDNIKALKSMTREPDNTSGIQYVDAWTDHLVTEAAESDNALILCKFNEVDPDGKEHYYYWQWTSAQPKTLCTLTNFWNKNNLTNSDSRLITYSPGSTTTCNDQKVNISLSAVIGKEFMHHQNVIRPKSGDCHVGYGGTYAVEWDGRYDKPQEIYGAMHVDVPMGQSLTSTWTNSVTGLLA